jgi:hypothetical protein
MELNYERYAATIPPWCGYRTLRQHIHSLGLCWSLVRIAGRGEVCPWSNCVNCDLRNPKYPAPSAAELSGTVRHVDAAVRDAHGVAAPTPDKGASA